MSIKFVSLYSVGGRHISVVRSLYFKDENYNDFNY